MRAQRSQTSHKPNPAGGTARCRVLLDESGKAIDFLFLQVDEGFERIARLARADVEGRRGTEVFLGIERLPFDTIGSFGRVALEGGELRFEDYFSPLGLWLSIQVFSPTHGEFIATFSDVTLQRNAEEERRRIFASAHCLLWSAYVTANPDGTLGPWETSFPDIEAAMRFMPIAREKGEPFYRSWHRARLAQDTARCERLGSESVLAGRSYTQEFRVRLADHSIRWMREDVHVSALEEGKRWRLVGVCVDVTEQKEAEEALREREELLRLATEVGGVGTFHVDAKTGTVTLGPLGQHLIESPVPTVPASEILDRIHPEDRPRVEEARLAGRDSERRVPMDITYRLVRKDGTARWVRVRGAYQFDETQTPPVPTGAAGVLIDITDVVERERALQSLVKVQTQELRIANDDLQSFVYSVAHDLKAPLRAILSTSKILQMEAAERLDDDQRHLLNRQVVNATKLAHLIDDLLALARVGRQPLVRREVDLSAMASDVATSYQGSRCTIVVQPGMQVEGDPALLRLLLENLIGNACKYSPEGGNVQVGCQIVSGERVFGVSDQGIGFDMQYAATIFLPFERLHRDSEIPGTGIGLASVKRVVERHGGRVWAESQPGKGSSFFFTLG